MKNVELESFTLKLIEKIQQELKNIDSICTDYLVNERIHNLLEFIEKETSENKGIFTEMILSKIKETRRTNPELNTDFYLLYRNVIEGKITMKEAQVLYDMYVKEMNTQ